MTTRKTGRAGLGRHSRLVGLAAVAVAVVALSAGCSDTTVGTTSSGSSSTDNGHVPTAADVPAAQLQAAIKRILLADVPVSEVPPTVADALAVGSTPLTPTQTDLLKSCLTQTSCETGHGTLTVGINADFTNNPWWAVRRAEATAQAIAYPQVKKIIFTTSTKGDVAEVLANLRSLIAQRVDFIVEDPIFGAAIIPAARDAQRAGIPFITENGPLPTEDESAVTTQFPFPLCSMAKAAVETMTKNATTGNKTYGLVTGSPGNAFSAVWWPCAQQSMQAASWTQVSTQYTDWTKQGEAQAANALLSGGQQPGALLYDSSLDNYLQPYVAAGKDAPPSFQDVCWYSFSPIYQSALDKGLKMPSYCSDGHVWYGRLGVTAGVEIKTGKTLPNKIMAPVPVVPFADVPKIAGMPANAPMNPLLPPDLVQAALAAH